MTGFDVLRVGSGELAIFNAALDGAGAYSGRWVATRPGPVPPVHGPPPRRGVGDPYLLMTASHTGYTLKVRWYTELGNDSCFARWLLIPVQAGG